MGLFKKPAPQIDNDDEIRREIRARVAKQAGIYDEEYIKTGKIGGAKPGDESSTGEVASHVSAAAVPIVTQNEKGEAEVSFEPSKAEPFVEASAPQAAVEAKQSKPGKEPKPGKEKKPPKEPKPPKTKKAPKKKKRNVAFILFILVLVIAFVPLYYYLTGSRNQVPELIVSTGDNTLFVTEALLVQGSVSDPDNGDGAKVYYSLDQGSATLLYTFAGGPGPFEYEIVLPDTADFIGEHTVTLYAEDTEGELSQSVVLNFAVIKPALSKLEVTTPPSDLKYEVGDKLNLKGLVMTATYENETTAAVTTYTSDPADGTKLTNAGDLEIIFSYVEENVTQTATFKITVDKATVVTPVTPPREVNSSYPIPSLELYKAGAGTADLQWNALSGVNGYQIQRKTGSSGSWSTVKTLSSAYTSWTDSGPSAGKTYYYRICSYKVVSGDKVYSPFSSSKSIAL